MPSQLVITYLDYGGEKSTTGIASSEITAANYAARVGEMTSLVAGINTITLGARYKTAFTTVITPGTSTPPTDKNAQRENKWLVTYQDSQSYLDPGPNTVPNPGFGKVFNIELPCADLSLLEPGTDIVDLFDPAVSQFITPFEVFARSPYGGTVTVLQIRHVGRAL